MSGGSLDYVFGRVEDAAIQIENRAENPLQKAFARHLVKVAQCLRDLEWHYSYDTDNPEPETIKRLLDNQDILEVLNKEALRLIKDLERYTK